MTLDSFGFEVASGTGIKIIPFHRIRRITYAGETVWEQWQDGVAGNPRA
jgi:hypothetical protein